jgi:hypothetical protein
MLTNVIDRRKRPYRFKKLNAVIEPTRHDNRCKDADRAKPNRKQDAAWMGYDEKEHVSLSEAAQWAMAHKDSLTLYLYDHDKGIYPVKKRRRKSRR